MMWLLLFLITLPVQAKVAGPLYTHAEREQKEFEHLYKAVNLPPAVIISTNVPSVVPNQTGDIFINTNTGKVYIATATLTSSSWAILN